ncbi:MAG: transcription-repair coupling factor [Desulfovibrionaceae bacterium]
MLLPKALSPFLEGGGTHLRVLKSGPASQARLALALVRAGQEVVLLAPGPEAYSRLSALLDLHFGAGDPLAPAWARPWIGLPPYPAGRPAPAHWADCAAALHYLSYAPRPRCVLVAAGNLLPLWPSGQERVWLSLTKGEELGRELVLEQAVAWGYQPSGMVRVPGEISARGDLLDLWAPGYPLPMRLEFFGDTLDELRLFDPETQRSKADLTEAVLLPVVPCPLAGDRLDEAREVRQKLRGTGELSPQAVAALDELAVQADGRVWPGLCQAKPAQLEELLPQGAVWLLAAADELRQRLADVEEAWIAALEGEAAKGLRWPAWLVFRGGEKARAAWLSQRQIVFEDLLMGREREGVELAETRVSAFTDLFWKPDEQRRPWPALMQGLAQWRQTRRQVALCFRSKRSRERFLALAEPEQLPFMLEYAPEAHGLFALVAPLAGGMDVSWDGSLILGEHVLQPGGQGDAGRAARRRAFEGMSRFDDLVAGDLLVHRDYGVCRFEGLMPLKVGAVANDYLLLGFDNDDKLYLPVDRIGLVQRYKGPEGHVPPLDKLGGARWRAATSRARKAVEKIAVELVEMYAYRRVAKGFQYGPPGELFYEFESGFGFEETPDQARAVEEVLADMEKPEPMDRLVCGDVGFGKTEVALRAAFRAVIEGRQAAILCPTTVLAEQHYQTFRSRMEAFPVRVEMLSRFVPAPRQKTILKAAARGEVDVLIGTHRLLSKDVALPNLGLIVLDEEQRFGVKHKEKLKHYRKTVDVLALTATPIPRTLQLSMSGIRGLSLIETPPEDRKPVATALVEYDKPLLAEALRRELERGGQVFWVRNRIQGLEDVARTVGELCPGARVGMAHGQMHERELEQTMHRFWHHELDVLVSTAIIESGLDFPNVNTLIVDQAQLFGLGQLYQLRGRVGRSDRQAFAYFVVPDLEALPEQSKRRLRIILELDYLGAGFKVAMEDLRLRGAGNILGEAQSGQMAKVGLDLYLEMLEEEVARLRGEEKTRNPEPEMQFTFKAHLPEGWVPESAERLRYYKALSSAADDARAAEIGEELADRFGPLPEEAVNFLGVLAVKRLARALGAARCELHPGRMVLGFEGEPRVAVDAILAWAAERRERARFLPPGKLELRCPGETNVAQGLDFLRAELHTLLAPDPAPAPAPDPAGNTPTTDHP